nr:MerR family transcriptional regulator [Cereibacter azotoformans]
MEKSAEAFRTISEVAEILETPAHVLRFWESRFPQIRPVKRAGGRRYYRPSDVALLAGIRRLLHDEGMTIRGVQKILREQGVRHVASLSGQEGSLVPLGSQGDGSMPPHEDEAGFACEETAEQRGEVVPFSRDAPRGDALRAEALRRPPSTRVEPSRGSERANEPTVEASRASAKAAAPRETMAGSVDQDAAPLPGTAWSPPEPLVPRGAEPPAPRTESPPSPAGRAPDAATREPESHEDDSDAEVLWRPTALRALARGSLTHRRDEVLALRERLLALRERLQGS